MAVERAEAGGHAPGGNVERVPLCVQWLGSRPAWLAFPEATAALDEAGVIESAELDRDLARRVASREAPPTTILHATGDVSRAVRSFRNEDAYGALAVDLSASQSPLNRAEARRLSATDLLLVGTIAALRETRRRYPFLAAKTAVFRTPVDLAAHDAARVRARLTHEGDLVLFAGPLTPAGGLDLAVEALARLDARLDPPALLALATGRVEKSYLAWCQQRAAAARIRLVVKSARETTIEEAYAAATIVCAPHRDPLGGDAARNAAAAGSPIVASEVEPLLELVEDGSTGYLVPVDDVVLLAEKLAKLLSDRRLRAEFSSNTREQAEAELSPQLAVSRLVALWGEAVRRRTRTPLAAS